MFGMSVPAHQHTRISCTLVQDTTQRQHVLTTLQWDLEACRIHVKPFHPEWLELEADQSRTISPEDCQDSEPFCKDWAASGEPASACCPHRACCKPSRPWCTIASSNGTPSLQQTDERLSALYVYQDHCNACNLRA